MTADRVDGNECPHQYVTHMHDGMTVRTCALCGRPDWDDLVAAVAAAADAVAARTGPQHAGTDTDAPTITTATVNRDLWDRIGRRIIVRNPANHTMWEGRLVAICDDPSLTVELDDGRQVTLPQRFEVEDPPPPSFDDVDQTLLWVLRRAVDEWGPRGVAEVAARLQAAS